MTHTFDPKERRRLAMMQPKCSEGGCNQRATLGWHICGTHRAALYARLEVAEEEERDLQEKVGLIAETIAAFLRAEVDNPAGNSLFVNSEFEDGEMAVEGNIDTRRLAQAIVDALSG